MNLSILKFTLILALLGASACDLKTKEEIYTARGNFGVLELPKATLDSILSASSNDILCEYQSSDIEINKAVRFLKKELKKRNQEVEKFMIYEIIKDTNQRITFYLDKIDYLVYSHYLDHNSDYIPLTGNATGVEGWYSVDLRDKSVSISYAQ